RGHWPPRADGAHVRLLFWGADKYGELGRPGDALAAPAEVAGLDQVTAIDGGAYHTCALAGGKVWCWGADAQGELGRGEATDVPAPDPEPVTGLADPIAIAL